MKKLFDELDIEKNCPTGTCSIGKKLYQQGNIKRIDIEKKIITGKFVSTNQVYYPEIIVKFDRLVSRCNCENNSFCEHSVALGFAYIYGIDSKNNKTTDFSVSLISRIQDIFSKKRTQHSNFNIGIMLDIKPENGTYSIFFFNKDNNEIIAQPENCYKEILSSSYINEKTSSFINYCIEQEYWQFFSPMKYYKESDYLNYILTNYPDIEYTNPTNNYIYKNSGITKLLLRIEKTDKNYKASCYAETETVTVKLSKPLITQGINDYLIIGNYFFKFKDKKNTQLARLFSTSSDITLNEEEIPVLIGDLTEDISKHHIKIQLDAGLKKIKIIKITPDIEINIKESENSLIAMPVFKYPEYEISEKISDNLYTKTTINNQTAYIKKDKHVQDKVHAYLTSYGFEKNGELYLSTDQNALKFIYDNKEESSGQYNINISSKLNNFKISPHNIEMTINITGNNSNLNISTEFHINKQKLKNSLINEAIAKKHDFIKTEYGYAIIPIEPIKKLLYIQSDYGSQYQLSPSFIMPEIRFGSIFNPLKKFITTNKKLLKYTQENNLSYAKEISINASLRDYQKKGVSWLNHLYINKWGGILADDMGLGKTIQTIAILSKAHSVKTSPSLIICPTSLIENWKREINRFCPFLKADFYYGNNRKNVLKNNKLNIIISTYGTIRNDIEELSKYSFNYIVIDEAQAIKNDSSITSHAVKRLNSTHKLALTGTPLENNLMELWSIFDFTTPGLLNDKSYFERKFMLFENEQSHSSISELKNIISPFILRRTKKEVLNDLPDKIETTRICSSGNDFLTSYKTFKNQIQKSLLKDIKDDTSFKKNTTSVFTALLRLRQYCCHPSLVSKDSYNLPSDNPKFDELKEQIIKIKETGHKALVFSQFTSMLHIIRDWLEEESIKFSYLDGSTRNRQTEVDQFNESKDKTIFLISLKAGGTGLNLTSADYVIHYDPWWNPAVENQATDRAHRIGQKNTVFSYKLITEGTIEERILELQQKKQHLFDNIVSDNNISSKMSFDDLKYLLS